MSKYVAAAPIFALLVGAPAWAEKHVEVHAPDVNVQVYKQSSGKTSARRRAAYPFQLVQATALIGQQIRDREGREMGRIQELAVDATQRRIAYAVLDLGEFLGKGEKLYAVPWQALSDPTPQDRGQRFVLNIEKDRLEQAEGFERGRWPAWENEDWAKDTYAFYGQDYPETRRLYGEPISTERRSSRSRRRVIIEEPRPLMLRGTEEVLGHRVRHAQNSEELGEIDDLLFDRWTGDLAFVLLKLDRRSSVMRSDSRKNYVALPAAMFNWNRHGDPNYPYTIECCLKRLGESRFSSDNWPDLASKRWAQDLYDSFGRQPYWEKQ